jgi:uncharacterized membrane protein
VISGTVVRHHGMQYVVPVVHQWRTTVLAINVGEALIPILLLASFPNDEALRRDSVREIWDEGS